MQHIYKVFLKLTGDLKGSQPWAILTFWIASTVQNFRDESDDSIWSCIWHRNCTGQISQYWSHKVWAHHQLLNCICRLISCDIITFCKDWESRFARFSLVPVLEGASQKLFQCSEIYSLICQTLCLLILLSEWNTKFCRAYVTTWRGLLSAVCSYEPLRTLCLPPEGALRDSLQGSTVSLSAS